MPVVKRKAATCTSDGEVEGVSYGVATAFTKADAVAAAKLAAQAAATAEARAEFARAKCPDGCNDKQGGSAVHLKGWSVAEIHLTQGGWWTVVYAYPWTVRVICRPTKTAKAG